MPQVRYHGIAKRMFAMAPSGTRYTFFRKAITEIDEVDLEWCLQNAKKWGLVTVFEPEPIIEEASDQDVEPVVGVQDIFEQAMEEHD